MDGISLGAYQSVERFVYIVLRCARRSRIVEDLFSEDVVNQKFLFFLKNVRFQVTGKKEIPSVCPNIALGMGEVYKTP